VAILNIAILYYTLAIFAQTINIIMTEDDWDLFDTLETDHPELQHGSCNPMDDYETSNTEEIMDSVAIQPDNIQHGAIQPGAIQHGAIQPDNIQHGAIQPGAIQPGAIQHGAIQPDNIQPGVSQPGNIQPGSPEDLSEMMKNLKILSKTPIICSACQSRNITHCALRGYNVCEDCGVINEYFLDKTPEWTTYESSEENNGRCGCATNFFLPKSSLGTSIKGKGFSRIEVLHRWGNMPYKERSLFGVLQDIEYRCRKNNIKKSIIDNAKILYKNINDTKHQTGDNKGKSHIFRGVNRKSLIAACVFYGAKLQGEPRSPKEIGDIFESDQCH
jgi:hypothetical protein